MDIQGDTLVVGSIGAAVGANSSEGVAYLFGRNQGGADNWGLVKRLEASTVISNLAEFGHSVAVDGTTVVVGSRLAYVPAHGGVFIYEKDEGGVDNWGVVQDLPGRHLRRQRQLRSQCRHFR